MKKRLLNRDNPGGLLIVAAGVLLRLVYVLGSTIYDRQYDIGMIDLDAGHTVSGGHLAYIQYLYENMRLPDMDPTTVYQFHHPPVHHFISALWLRLISLFTANTDVIEEAVQVVPFVCSLVMIYATVQILKRFELSKTAYNFALAVICFHPSLILISGSVNNDCMALMFSFLCILATMRWIDKQSVRNIVFMALWLGLGISTKQNVAELAFVIAIIFVVVLTKTVKSGSGLKQLIVQYLIFGIISVPLGMWFYIRNLVKYNVSILWVYELPADSWQYTGNIPVINRFLWPIPSEMLDNLKNFKIGCGYNVWMQLMRTSVLGEWDMASVGKAVKLVAVALMLAGAFLAVVAAVFFVKAFVCKSADKEKVINPMYRLLFVGGYAVTMLFYFGFAYRYPQQCSMHFRYIEITLLLQAAGLAVTFDSLKNKKIRVFLWLCLAAFAVLSMAMCAVWCIQS